MVTLYCTVVVAATICLLVDLLFDIVGVLIVSGLGVFVGGVFMFAGLGVFIAAALVWAVAVWRANFCSANCLGVRATTLPNFAVLGLAVSVAFSVLLLSAAKVVSICSDVGSLLASSVSVWVASTAANDGTVSVLLGDIGSVSRAVSEILKFYNKQ